MDMPTLNYRCENNKKWTMNYLSRECEEIMDLPADKITSDYIVYGNMIHEQDRDIVWDSVQTAIEKHCPYNLRYRINTVAGKEKLLFEQGQGIYTRSGKLIELKGFISDITSLFKPILPDIKTCAQEIEQLAFNLGYTNKHTMIAISEREIEVAIYSCQGMTMKEVGMKLQLSYRTVEGYLNRIKIKLGCHTKSQLRNLFLLSNIGKALIKNHL